MNKAALLITVFLLSGCTMMPFYHRPSAPIADQWSSEQDKISASLLAADIGWRSFFKDARLQKLVEIALENNRDLRIAALNVESLQAQYRIGTAYGFPTIDGIGSGLRQHQPTTKKGDYKSTGKYSAVLGVTSYEIDLWGRIRSLRAQALEGYFASQEAQRNAQISLVAQVAIEYLNALQLDEELVLTKNVLKSQEDYYQLIKKSYELGNTSELDLRSIESQVQIAKVNAADYTRQREQSQNNLVLLLGQGLPNDLPSTQPLLTSDFLQDLSTGLPSDLIQRRPDILEAEHQLKGANANIGAARAAFFPKILLTGSGGSASLALSSLFSGPLAWSFSPQITLPIFDAGANKASLDLAQINKRIEIAQYEKTIQTAFREVADALIARSTFNEQTQAQQDLVAAQKKRYELADIRYRNGIDSYLTVLSAQQDLYSAQQTLIKTRFTQLANLVTLYKTLGGGWEENTK